MAKELIGNLGYGAPQSDTKHQKLLECVLTGNSKLYLGKVYTEEQLAKLNEEEVKKLFNNYEAKLSSHWEIDHKYVFNGSLFSARNNQSGCSE